MPHYALAALTHVATQMSSKWLEDPGDPGVQSSAHMDVILEKCKSNGIASVTGDDWLRFLRWDLEKERGLLPWLTRFHSSGLISLEQLSTVAAEHFRAVSANGASSVFIGSDQYPKLLRHIARPPLFLTVLGNSGLLTLRHVAIIGSRKASYDALRMSVEVGLTLAKHNFVVVSGGAIGCDIATHEGMLASDADHIKALVVFAGGLSGFFPRCNSRAFREILERGGLLISERLWHQDARPRDFPARNRIVSGMSESVAVMAAAERSGSLITAQEALEQGRDVYVFLPRSCGHDVRFKGSLNLVADGARSFSEPHELVDNLAGDADELFCSDSGSARDTCQAVDTLGTLVREPIKCNQF